MGSIVSQDKHRTLEVDQQGRSEIDRLIQATYDDFRKLANTYLAGKARSHTLQPTAVVHEVFLKLVGQPESNWNGKSHFFAVGAKVMRQILVDHARGKATVKRGGDWNRHALDDQLSVSTKRNEDILALDEILNRLSKINETRAKLVEMRFFAGMALPEIASVLGVSTSTVKRQWAATSSWLRAELLKAAES